MTDIGRAQGINPVVSHFTGLLPMSQRLARAPRALRLAYLPLALACAVAAPFAAAHAQQMSAMLGPVDGKDMKETDIERVAIGAMAPDFTLAKFGGGTTTLSSLRGKKNVVLVFYRGYWCPYCVAQLKEMRTMLSDELKQDTEMLVVSIDDEKGTQTAITRISADGMKPDFAFLSDPDHAVIARYGIMNPAGSRRGIPHPATYVIDKKGVVRWRDVQTDYKIRPANAAVLSAVQALPTR
ncbi:MAG: peroxiredoxin family protein [Gemmatimonas sp.]